MQTEMITIYQAADILGIFHTTVGGHINRGNLKVAKFGDQYALSLADVLKFKEAWRSS